MKLRTERELCDCIDRDFAWRRKELTYLKFLLDKYEIKDHQEALLRSSVALLYAHWEGFIKNAGNAYLNYVAFQRAYLKDLSPNFLALATRKILMPATQTRKIDAHIKVVNFFRSGLSGKSELPYKEEFATQGNLSSSVFREIVETLGLDYSPFTLKSVLIDKTLLERRNMIAHGEYLVLDKNEYEELKGKVIEMMEIFQTQIQEAVTLSRFKITG